MNYAAIKKCDIANGPGVRLSLFVSGCRNHCKGCFQPETWCFQYGSLYTSKVEQSIFDEVSKSYYQGLSILGGDPFEPENIDTCTELCKRLKMELPLKDIWVYTGYLYEDLKDKEILQYIDVLVDSPFDITKRDFSNSFRGSTNQRVIKLRGGIAYEGI